jgi:CubicO group peptidase (beta-lactamase class C family)
MKAALSGLVALVLLGSTAPAHGQGRGALVQRLDAIAGAGVSEQRAVGIVTAVVKGKDPLLVKAYGKADVEGDVAMTADTVVAIGSVTKQFTAAAILQLRDGGKLSLDDPLTKWLPDFETRGHTVTLRHLLAHTSGIADITSMQELRELRVMRNATVTRDDVYKVINRQPFMFPTGTMEAYSNTNYWLLGLVVEKASGMTYEDYVERRVFAPLEMTRSMYCNAAETVAGRASGYGMRGGTARRVPDIVHTATFAAGALCSTARDMATWLKALHGGKVLKATSYAEMIRPATLDDGTRLRYAMGLTVGEDSHGLPYIGHSGGGFGFSSEARWYPAARLAIVVLTNSEPDEMTTVTESMAAEILPPPPPAGPFKGDTSLLAGTYRGPGRGKDMVVEVTTTPEGLAFAFDGAAAAAAPWVADWTFRRGDALLVFRRAGGGPATELRFDTGGGHFILKRQ